MNIGNKLKTLRTAKGYSPEQIADLLNISKSTYGRYERNETVPDLNILEKIAKQFEIPISDLVVDEKEVLSSNNKEVETNDLLINQLSQKLIEQYEIRLDEKNATINELKSEIQNLKNSNNLN